LFSLQYFPDYKRFPNYIPKHQKGIWQAFHVQISYHIYNVDFCDKRRLPIGVDCWYGR